MSKPIFVDGVQIAGKTKDKAIIRKRGITIEFEKKLYKKIAIAARIEGKNTKDFATNVLSLNADKTLENWIENRSKN